MIILLLFSVLAGLVTVLSPCILPVLPVLLAAGVGQGRYRPLGTIIGLVISFSFFTLTLTALVHATGVSPDVLRYASIALIAFFGLTMLFPKLGDRFAAMTSGIARLGSSVQETSTHAGTGFASGFVLGIALGLIWTPCAGPILAAITTLVATHAVTWHAIAVTLAYSTGAAIPMFLISYGGSKIISSTQSIGRYAETIRKVFGALMIAGACALAFHFDVVLQQLAVKYFPMITIEDNPTVRKELMKLRSNPNPDFSFDDDDPKHRAPEFVGITQWFNTQPLTLAQLRGKVVLVDFWTYSCINCVRTLPYVKEWYAKYKDKGFVVIGIHTPEFEFEKSPTNVQDAIKRFGITYPVGMDNNFKTWQNYNNNYWPAHYLVDQRGVVKHKHFGEGAYTETENAIRSLIGLPPRGEDDKRESAVANQPSPKGYGGQEAMADRSGAQLTPETYLGYERGRHYHEDISLQKNRTVDYNYHGELEPDQIGLKGAWLAGPQSLQAQEDGSILDLNFIAGHVYLVMQSPTPQVVTVLLDDQPVPTNYETVDMKEEKITVHEARMYDVLDLKGEHGRHKLTLRFPLGVVPYVFTFGK